MLDHHIDGYFKHGSNLHPGSVVFDVGANIGVFGVRVMQQHPGVKLIAFEPIPDIHKVTEANGKKYGFTALNCGLGEKPGQLDFMYYPNSPALSTSHPEMWDDNAGSLERATASSMKNAPDDMWYARWLPGFVAKLYSKFMRSRPVRVNSPVYTVSQIMDQHNCAGIDMLKVDCEGAELDVLLGVEERHWPTVKQVVCEVCDFDGRLKKIEALLQNAGFSRIIIEEEDALQGANLYNIYAFRD
jgi:FkbM family methyltransferase